MWGPTNGTDIRIDQLLRFGTDRFDKKQRQRNNTYRHTRPILVPQCLHNLPIIEF